MFFPFVCVMDATVERPPLPESLLTESATDLDSGEAGEVEYEANLGLVGARRGGARATLTSLEVEWRVLRELGVRLEPSYARLVDPGGVTGRNAWGVAGALAFGLFHDFPRDIHVQAELTGRTLESANARVFEPGETELPFALDIVSAIRLSRWTFRLTAGAEAGDHVAHAPIHTDGAILTGFTRDERFGFFGLEVRADWARETPLVIAPDIVAVATPLGLPFSLSLALPVNIGANDMQTSYGVFVRLMLLTSREAAYGER